ncbi:MAG: hypothetical protein ACOYL6_10380 [Bacteriovoracaceae bacterium]
MRFKKNILSFTLLVLTINSQAFADSSESEKKSFITDTMACKGDVFCVDKMRVTCNARKEVVSDVYDRAVNQTDGDLHRDDVTVEAKLRKNGKQDQDVANVKKVECLLNVSSTDRTWIFRETTSKKMKNTSDCKTMMEKNIQSGKRVIFQQIRESRNILLQRLCRVYLLELIKK